MLEQCPYVIAGSRWCKRTEGLVDHILILFIRELDLGGGIRFRGSRLRSDGRENAVDKRKEDIPLSVGEEVTRGKFGECSRNWRCGLRRNHGCCR